MDRSRTLKGMWGKLKSVFRRRGRRWRGPPQKSSGAVSPRENEEGKKRERSEKDRNREGEEKR